MSCHGRVLGYLLRGWAPPAGEGMRGVVSRALDAFSCRPLQRMERAGVRIWPERFAVPPEYARDFAIRSAGSGERAGTELHAAGAGVVATHRTHGSPAEYLPAIRTVVIERDRITAYRLVHELAHVWDDVRDEAQRSLQALDGLSAEARRTAIRRVVDDLNSGRVAVFRSQVLPRRPGRRPTTLAQMWDLYRGRVTRRELAFGLGGDGQSLRNPAEFYAEGYAVFHAADSSSRARLQQMAPELWAYLIQESRNLGIALPGGVTAAPAARPAR